MSAGPKQKTKGVEIKMQNLLYISRIRRGMTQQALADLAGVSRRTVCYLEEGAVPSLRVARRLCRALQAVPEEVFSCELSL